MIGTAESREDKQFCFISFNFQEYEQSHTFYRILIGQLVAEQLTNV